ncbi:MAG: hypothetical protein VCG02_09200 [Verrucomicrobiota bacterium]|jgi:hypothetical protein
MLLSSELDCAASIRGVLCPDDGVWNCRLDGKTLQIGVHSGPLGSPGDSRSEIGDADAIALVVHYMDVITLDQLRDTCTLLRDHHGKVAVFLYREEGEVDCKMSCPSCGQKLWVRDTDVGKRGRCPNCKKAFMLPDQAEHIRAELALDPGISITRVEGGNISSSKSAMRMLVDQLGE